MTETSEERPMVHKVLVIGAGVTGLTTALALKNRRDPTNGEYQFKKIKVLAERTADKTVSVIAGALWEFPPAVCGMHGNQVSVTRSERWCMTAYREFQDIAKYAGSSCGVRMRKANFYFGIDIEKDQVERNKKKKLESAQDIVGFGMMSTTELDVVRDRLGKEHVLGGYHMYAPVIDTPVYTEWLRNKLLEADENGIARVEMLTDPRHWVTRITDRLDPQEDMLRAKFDVDAIVNCTGLGAAELAGAAMIPLRGALIKIPRSKFKEGKAPVEAYAMAKSPFKQDMIFVVPREQEVMLGGIAEPGEYDTHIGWDYRSVEGNYPIQEMFDRCMRFLGGSDGNGKPDVGAVLVDEVASDPARHLEVTVGLRPYRVENVCLERDHMFNIVHNYGHSGSGFSFSYGCAEEVADLIQGMEGAAFHTPYPKGYPRAEAGVGSTTEQPISGAGTLAE